MIDVHPAEHNEAIRIQPGYPPWMFEDMEDPRANPMIFEALERAEKLQCVVVIAKGEMFRFYEPAAQPIVPLKSRYATIRARSFKETAR